jgi:electron transfer flavoprotein beta subunit
VKIGVCIKQGPAPEVPALKIKDAVSGVDLTGVKLQINVYDEYALEEALRLKDAKIATEVIVYTLGPADAEARLKDAIARGADKAVRVEDPGLEGADSLGVAKALAAALKADGVSLVLAGKRATDTDNSQVPAMIAEILGWPQALEAEKFEVAASGFKAWVPAGGGARYVLAGALPAVISLDKGANELRTAGLKGVMAAKKAKVDVKNLAALGLSAAAVSPMVKLSDWGPPPARPQARVLSGSNADMAKELVRLLRNEAKVI